MNYRKTDRNELFCLDAHIYRPTRGVGRRYKYYKHYIRRCAANERNIIIHLYQVHSIVILLYLKSIYDYYIELNVFLHTTYSANESYIIQYFTTKLAGYIILYIYMYILYIYI